MLLSQCNHNFLSNQQDPCSAVTASASMMLNDNSFYISPETEIVIKTAQHFLERAVPPFSDYFVNFSHRVIIKIRSTGIFDHYQRLKRSS